MVACHKNDLRAARAAGLKTAFIPRPLEHGKENSPDLDPEPDFDINAEDFNVLAERLGA